MTASPQPCSGRTETPGPGLDPRLKDLASSVPPPGMETGMGIRVGLGEPLLLCMTEQTRA